MQLKRKPIQSSLLLSISSLSIIALIFLTQCKRRESALKGQTEGLPTDFTTFYDKFHSDSAYQMAHITFPLEGYPSNADSATLANGGFYWQKDKWIMHKMEGFSDSLYNRQFDISMPGIINETIRQKNTPYSMYRRFYKRGDDWQLIFYADMNAVKEN